MNKNTSGGSSASTNLPVERSLTSASLLRRLRDRSEDDGSWAEFVNRYGPKIMKWCRQSDLQHADSQDVTQLILVKLAERMTKFDYDRARSFRAWLKTVTRNAVTDFYRERNRKGRNLELANDDQHILAAPGREADLLELLAENFEIEIMDEAMERVRARVTAQRWQAFAMTAIEGCSGAEAAKALDMKVSNVFSTRSKIQRMIQEEVRRLEA